MTRIIGISSGKGGVGKTTVTANLALALQKFGKKVVMVDSNLSTPHLSYYLGVNDYRVTLNDVMRGTASVESAMYNYDGVRFVPASLNLNDLIGVDLRKFKKTITQLMDPQKIDYILLDSAPGLGREAICVLHSADEILFVTTPFVPMVNDVIRCVEVLKQLGRKRVGVVLNMTTGKRHELFDSTVENVVGVPVVGEIPFDKNMPYSLVMGTPILNYDSRSNSSIAFMQLAATLSGEHYEPPNRLERAMNGIKGLVHGMTNRRIRMMQEKGDVESEMFIQEGQDKGQLKRII